MLDPGLGNLAMIGNCQVNFLVDPNGQVAWGCWPRPDGDPIFCGLLRHGPGSELRGSFRIELTGQTAGSIEYRRNTAIVESVLSDDRGNSVRVTDFCPRFRRFGRMFRPSMLIRKVEQISGRPVVRIRLRPSAADGGQTLRAQIGSHHLSFREQELAARLTTDASLTYLTEERPFVLDHPLHFVLGPDETLAQNPADIAREFAELTEDYWREWVRSLSLPSEWQLAVIRSAITLKLCSFEDTGAILAAPTTSVPEDATSGRNWDYRYCWLRDSYFTVQALNRLGATRTMEAYLNYIDTVVCTESDTTLQPVYGISGARTLTERIVPALEGYRGSGPVRIGNQAYQQPQHDVYGSVILASTQAFFDERLAVPGDAARFHRLEILGERAALLFDDPDAGIWEFRGRKNRHTFSAAMCWAACDRLARIAAQQTMPERAHYWRKRSETIGQQILSRAWHQSSECLSSDLDRFSVDASVLLLPELGLIPWNDPRFLSTMARIETSLVHDGFLMRYRHADDFGRPENAFIVCSFWWVNALAATGRQTEARALFERLLDARNAVGLLSEHLDPGTGELWGNFPQTYSMVGIITSALRLSTPWEDVL